MKQIDVIEDNIYFEEQEKSGFNSRDYYQFGSNCCIGCKRDRQTKEEGLYCDICKNYQYQKPIN